MVNRVVERDVSTDVGRDQAHVLEFQLVDKLCNRARLVCNRIVNLPVFRGGEAHQVWRDHLEVCLRNRLHHAAPHQGRIEADPMNHDDRCLIPIATGHEVGHQALVEPNLVLRDSRPSQPRGLQPAQGSNRMQVKGGPENADEDGRQRADNIDPRMPTHRRRDQIATDFCF
jgi:hypothetical protein